MREQAIQEAERIDRLRMDLSRPMVYFDVAIKGRPVGRITMVRPSLFAGSWRGTSSREGSTGGIQTVVQAAAAASQVAQLIGGWG